MARFFVLLLIINTATCHDSAVDTLTGSIPVVGEQEAGFHRVTAPGTLTGVAEGGGALNGLLPDGTFAGVEGEGGPPDGLLPDGTSAGVAGEGGTVAGSLPSEASAGVVEKGGALAGLLPVAGQAINGDTDNLGGSILGRGTIVSFDAFLTFPFGKGGSQNLTPPSKTTSPNGIESFKKDIVPLVDSLMMKIKQFQATITMSFLKVILEVILNLLGAAQNRTPRVDAVENKIKEPVNRIVQVIQADKKNLQVAIIMKVLASFVSAILKIVVRLA